MTTQPTNDQADLYRDAAVAAVRAGYRGVVITDPFDYRAAAEAVRTAFAPVEAEVAALRVERDAYKIERDEARAEVAALRAQLAEAHAELRDLAEHGLRADLNPTMDCRDVLALYGQFSTYLHRIDQDIRARAAAVLVGGAGDPAGTLPFPCCDHCGCGQPSGVWPSRDGHDDTCSHGCNDGPSGDPADNPKPTCEHGQTRPHWWNPEGTYSNGPAIRCPGPAGDEETNQ